MDNTIYLINLYDYYSELLTEKQQEYFEYYYFNNLSLSEISENIKVSRNAVHNSLKETVNKLEFYEEKLQLYKKSQKIKEIIKTLDENLQNKIKELI